MRLPTRLCLSVCLSGLLLGRVAFPPTFLCSLLLLKHVFSLVLKPFLSPPGARPHPRCQHLFPERPNLHEVTTKRANLPTLRGTGAGVEGEGRGSGGLGSGWRGGW